MGTDLRRDLEGPDEPSWRPGPLAVASQAVMLVIALLALVVWSACVLAFAVAYAAIWVPARGLARLASLARGRDDGPPAERTMLGSSSKS